MLNIIFFGTPDFAGHFLASLDEDEDLFVSAVVSQPDKPAGRKNILTPPPTKVYAQKHNITVLQPQTLKQNNTFINKLTKLSPDLFVIIAYGKIIPKAILDIPRLGAVNVHPSLLPKYRGPSPIQSAIAAGETKSGITIMLVDRKMDHGPILKQEKISLDERETPETFRKKIIETGAPLLTDTIKKYAKRKINPRQQDHSKATYCSLLSRKDGKIDWAEQANRIEQKIRAFTPWPGTWTTFNGDRVKIHKARVSNTGKKLEPGEIHMSTEKLFVGTGTAPLEIIEIQPAGKQKMPAKAFVHGNSKSAGKIFGK